MNSPMTQSVPATSESRIKFKNPPINELVIAMYHLPVTEMRAQHIGIYWQRIRDRYPICEQQPPIASDTPAELAMTLQNMAGEVYPLPRFWFSNADQPTLIQIQRNAFILNWRKGANNSYPHYEEVEKNFWKEFAEYVSFIQETLGNKVDVVSRCELTYIDIIEKNDLFSSPAELKNVLPLVASQCDVQSDRRKFVGINSAVTYRINENLLIEISTKLGKRVDTKEMVAMLEMKAHGTPTDISIEGARSWYQAAHDAIYETFLTITSKRVQQEVWEPL